MTGLLRTGRTNLEELETLHLTTNYWSVSERVAKRLDKSSFNHKKYWLMLANLHDGNVKKSSWNELSKFLEDCPDDLFKYFFTTLDRSSEFSLAKFLTIIRNSKASGEEIFTFLVNMTNCTPCRVPDGKNENGQRFSGISTVLTKYPNFDLMKFDELFNHGRYIARFLTFDQIVEHVKNPFAPIKRIS